jgi:hypothetical protein
VTRSSSATALLLALSAAAHADHRTVTTFVELAQRVHADCAVRSATLVSCAGPVRIDNLSGTSVRGHGVHVEFSDSRPGRGGILLVNAADVDFTNVEISWLGGGARDPSIAGVQRIQSLGIVTACANGSAGGSLSMDLPLEGTQPLGAVTVWNDTIGWPWYRTAPDAVEVYFANGTQASFSAGKSNCFPQLGGLMGQRVLVRHFIYANHAFQCWNCRHLTVEDVRVTSAPGTAFMFVHGGSNLTLRRDVVAPACSPHCVRPEPSITADAAHFAGVGDHILIEKNDFGWQGDDSVNITGVLIPARAVPAAEPSQQWLSVDQPWRPRVTLLQQGNKVFLFDGGLSALGEAEIVSADASTGQIGLSTLPPGVTDLIIAREDTVPSEVVIHNNRFHDHRARGILIGGSDALIENNVIDKVTSAAILVPADTGPWYEGPGAQNVTIKRNQISDVNRYADLKNYPSAISAGVSSGAGYAGKVGTPIRHILVEENTFSRIYSNAEVPVFFGAGVADSEVTHEWRGSSN